MSGTEPLKMSPIYWDFLSLTEYIVKCFIRHVYFQKHQRNNNKCLKGVSLFLLCMNFCLFVYLFVCSQSTDFIVHLINIVQ